MNFNMFLYILNAVLSIALLSAAVKSMNKKLPRSLTPTRIYQGGYPTTWLVQREIENDTKDGTVIEIWRVYDNQLEILQKEFTWDPK